MAPAVSQGDGAVRSSAGGFVPVAVGDVEPTLASARRGRSRDDMPLSRACALNLLYFIDEQPDAELATGVVESVARAHPIRAIGLSYDTALGEDEVRAAIKVEHGDQVAGGRLASEVIALSAHPDGASRLASAVRGVLVPDLPMALWWRAGSPFLNRLFKSLAPAADLIVVDSIRFGDGAAALDTLRRISDLRRGAVALEDMNWKRTSTWRNAVSACFEDRDVLAMLDELDHCDIEYSLGPDGADAQPSARSLLLAGWILTRRPALAGHGDIRGRRSGWASPGAVVGVCLRSSTSKAAVRVAWRSEHDVVASASDPSGDEIRRWQMRPDPEDEAMLLSRCVDTVSHDDLLDAALRAD